MSNAEIEELARLRREMDLSSLGDRPPSMAVAKLRRLIELETKEQLQPPMPYCWVCRSHHQLVASECRAMDSIA